MATIKPLKGVRPALDKVALVASKPYDVLNSKEAREEAKGNAYSFLHVVKPEIDLPETIGIYADEVYQKGKNNLYKFIDEGILIRDEKPNIYIYKLVWKSVIQVGIVARVSVQEYENDIIKKHEKTRKDKEKDRIKHVETQNANAGPIFLTYRQNNQIDSIVEDITKNPPLYNFNCGDGVEHTLWKVENIEIVDKIVLLFKKIDYLYVADGHHRSASAAIVGAKRKRANPFHTGKEGYNYFLSVLFPHTHLYIMDYNRIVFDLNGLSINEFIAKVMVNFKVTKTLSIKKPEKPHNFRMYVDGCWYCLVAKNDIIDEDNPVKSLDTAILQNYLLGPILGIKDPTKDKRIDFVGGIRGLSELSGRINKKGGVAFALHAMSIEQLMAIADVGEIMPPKSTWFEPKLRSGVIVNLLD